MVKKRIILKYSETEEYDISEVLRWLAPLPDGSNTFDEVVIRV